MQRAARSVHAMQDLHSRAGHQLKPSNPHTTIGTRCSFVRSARQRQCGTHTNTRYATILFFVCPASEKQRHVASNTDRSTVTRTTARDPAAEVRPLLDGSGRAPKCRPSGEAKREQRGGGDRRMEESNSVAGRPDRRLDQKRPPPPNCSHRCCLFLLSEVGGTGTGTGTADPVAVHASRSSVPSRPASHERSFSQRPAPVANRVAVCGQCGCRIGRGGSCQRAAAEVKARRWLRMVCSFRLLGPSDLIGSEFDGSAGECASTRDVLVRAAVLFYLFKFT